MIEFIYPLKLKKMLCMVFSVSRTFSGNILSRHSEYTIKGPAYCTVFMNSWVTRGPIKILSLMMNLCEHRILFVCTKGTKNYLTRLPVKKNGISFYALLFSSVVLHILKLVHCSKQKWNQRTSSPPTPAKKYSIEPVGFQSIIIAQMYL